jgi:hypothetical protein
MSTSEFTHRHPAVRWVYRTGGQIGNEFWAIMPIRNSLHDLQAGDGCVVVQEGPAGCLQGGPWRPVYSIDLKTGAIGLGRLTSGHWVSVNTDYAGPEEDLPGWRGRLPGQWTVWITPTCRDICLGKVDGSPESYTRLLSMREDGGFSPSLWAVEAQPGVMVIGSFSGYVICVDLAMLPEPRTKAGGPPATSAAASGPAPVKGAKD